MWRYGSRFVVCVVVAMTCHRGTIAEDPPDTVWIEPARTSSRASSWYPGSIIQRKGIISSFDQTALRMIVAEDQTETAVAAHQVLWIEPGSVSEKESALVALFAQQKRPDSLLLLRDVLSEPLPRWRKQWLMMSAAHSMWNVSRDTSSLQIISSVDSQPLPPLLLSLLPVAWTRIETEPSEFSMGQLTTDSTSPELQLVYVSWRLRSLGRDRSAAMIDQLVSNQTRPYIRQLAVALRWRLATPQEVIEHADQWEAKIDALPMALQVGPTLTLIEKLEAAGLADRAERLQLSLRLTPPFPHPDIPRD